MDVERHTGDINNLRFEDFGINGDGGALALGSINSQWRKEQHKLVLPVISATVDGTYPSTGEKVTLTLYHSSQTAFAKKATDMLSEMSGNGISPRFVEFQTINGMPTVITEKAIPVSNVRLPLGNKIQVIQHTASILDYLHSKGITHHNVNMGSIVLCKRGNNAQVFLRGFELATNPIEGSAARIRENEAVRSVLLSNLNPNERSYAIDNIPATDQYYLAKTAYHLLGGREDYPINKPDSMSPQVWNVIRKGMKPNSFSRYYRCGEFAEELSIALEADLQEA